MRIQLEQKKLSQGIYVEDKKTGGIKQVVVEVPLEELKEMGADPYNDYY